MRVTTTLLLLSAAMAAAVATGETRKPTPTSQRTTATRPTPRARARARNARGDEPVAVETSGAGSYWPGEVKPANESSGCSEECGAPFDFDASLDEILDYFHKMSALPTASPSENKSMSAVDGGSAGGSAGGSDSLAREEIAASSGSRMSENDFFSRDPAVGEKPYGPQLETPAAKIERESAATLSQICDVAFFFLALTVAAFYY